MRQRIVPLLVMLLAFPATAPSVDAQTVRGQVVDSTTHLPTRAALVRLIDASRAELARAATDRDGSFSFELPGAGSYVLRVERVGYRPWRFPFELQDDDDVTATLVVLWTAADVPELEPVIVEAEAPRTRRPLTDFWERRRTSAVGSFITREEFEKQGAPRLATDVLRRMQGVRVRTNPDYMKDANSGDPFSVQTNRWRISMGRAEARASQARMGRGCAPLYFIDRHYVGTALDVDIDQILPLIDLEAVEAYASIAVPREFARRGFDCGVIVFWTR